MYAYRIVMFLIACEVTATLATEDLELARHTVITIHGQHPSDTLVANLRVIERILSAVDRWSHCHRGARDHQDDRGATVQAEYRTYGATVTATDRETASPGTHPRASEFLRLARRPNFAQAPPRRLIFRTAVLVAGWRSFDNKMIIVIIYWRANSGADWSSLVIIRR